jgi:hypothetical protein
MNVLLSVVQVLLALLSIAGGAYKLLAYQQFAKMPAGGALSHGAWIAIGVFEVICGIFVIVPVAKRRLIPIAATALAIESIALAVLYARYSTELTAQNPLVWVVVMAVMAAFIAFGRFSQRA